MAQTLTAVRRSTNRKLSNARSDFFEIEIQDFDRKTPYPDEEDSLPPHAGNYKNLAPPFDFERLTRFMAYGFLMAPVQHTWFSWLSSTFPITATSATGPAIKRVAVDQLVFAPVGLACFFTFMTVTEGGSLRDVRRKFEDVYIPALKVNLMVWPAVQMLNFRVLPIQFQIVSRALHTKQAYANEKSLAFRVYGRYCLDGVFVNDQLGRGAMKEALVEMHGTCGHGELS